jgi:hypothetical protein
VYPADGIPLRWSRPAAIIANTDDHTQPGQHWVAFYNDGSGNGVYFDSYGVAPIVPHHVRRLRRNCPRYRFNARQLQSAFSDVCGQFCVMFLYYMHSGYTLEQFVGIFSDDYARNDRMAAAFYECLVSKSKHCDKPHVSCMSLVQKCFKKKQ